MKTLSIVCISTNNRVYSYTFENNLLNLAVYRANKAFNCNDYRMTLGDDFNVSDSSFIGHEEITD